MHKILLIVYLFLSIYGEFEQIKKGIYSGADIITYPTKEILSKMAFFKKAWQTLKVMPYP